MDAARARQLPRYRVGLGRECAFEKPDVLGYAAQPRQYAIDGHLALIAVAAQFDPHNERSECLRLEPAVLAVPQHKALGRGLTRLVAVVADIENGHGVPGLRDYRVAGDR